MRSRYRGDSGPTSPVHWLLAPLTQWPRNARPGPRLQHGARATPSQNKRGAPRHALHSVPTAVPFARRHRGARACVAESHRCVGWGGGSLSCVSQRTRRRRLRIQDSALRLYGWGSSAPSIAKIDQKPPGGAGSKQVARPSRAFGQHHYQRGGQVRE